MTTTAQDREGRVKKKRKTAAAICAVILLPLVIAVLLQSAFVAVAGFVEWCCEDRRWSLWLVRQAERVQQYFGVDAETEHEEWRERMGCKITTPKPEPTNESL